MNRFKVGPRMDLWRRESKHRYIPAAQFSRFISFKRFEDLRKHISFLSIDDKGNKSRKESNIEDPRGEQERWDLCEGSLNAINAHRQQRVKPCEFICVDESISRWYGKGRSWLSEGFLHYVAINRKSENGSEIQNSACGRSGISIRFSFVKSALLSQKETSGSNLNNGTVSLRKLCAPWIGTQRIICADSFFASVEAAALLFTSNTRFIGVIKNSTKKYPMKALGEEEMTGQGDHRSMIAEMQSGEGVNFQVMAVSCVDRTRSYFVSTVGTSTLGTPQHRIRWRGDDEGAFQKFVSLDIPSVAEDYYATAYMIDRHNRTRQDDLGIEKSFRVKDWSLRINCTLMSMCVVDSYLWYIGGRGKRDSKCPMDFFSELAAELIENSFDQVGLRGRSPSTTESNLSTTGEVGGVRIHLSPTKKTPPEQE